MEMTAVLMFIIGTFTGSFMLCLTYEEVSMLRHSQCECCNHRLRWYDLIPIFSFVMLKARCRYCKVRLSSKYLISEVLTGAAFYMIAKNNVFDFTMVCCIALILIPIAIYDTEHLKIPNFMLILLTLLLMLTLIDDFLLFKINLNTTTLIHKLIILILFHLFFFLTKSIGYGDIKLFSILLIFLPIPFFISLFFVTYLIGGLACIIFLSYKSDLKKMPLVPFITSAFFVVLMLYEAIKKLYFGGFV